VTGTAQLQVLTERYRAGDGFGAVAELAAWSPRQLRAAGADAVKDLRSPASAWMRSSWKAAALLLTEGAAVAQAQGDSERFAACLDAAAAVARAGRSPDPGAVSFVSRWYRLAGLLWMGSPEPEAARRLLDEGLEQVPGDGHLSLLLGVLDETLARTPAQAAVVWRLDPAPAGLREGMLRRRSLLDAEGSYRKSLAADAGLVESRLRLGWVLLATARLDGAERELARVEDTAADPRLRYLAALFRGRRCERQGDWSGAVEAYRRACRSVPTAPSGWLALGHALEVTGVAADRADILDHALLRPGAEPVDPWWLYGAGTLEDTDALAAELRREVGR
jgi:tetratricopeptide (TPR) repeat protein